MRSREFIRTKAFYIRLDEGCFLARYSEHCYVLPPVLAQISTRQRKAGDFRQPAVPSRSWWITKQRAFPDPRVSSIPQPWLPHVWHDVLYLRLCLLLSEDAVPVIPVGTGDRLLFF